MSLRLKLLLLGLFTLVLPFEGYEYARQMEAALRDGEQQSLLAIAQTIATSLQGRVDLLYRLTPDSGPAHMATMVGLPVLGLYAATRTARAGPYLSRGWCVDKYDAAARQYYGKPETEVPWTLKIEKPGVMDLICVDEVTAKLDQLLSGLKAAKMSS